MLGTSSLQLTPTTAAAGDIVFTLRNAGILSRTVTVAGKTSPIVRPGQQVIFKVTVTSGGSLVVTSAGAAGSGAKSVTATLKVTGGTPATTSVVTTTAAANGSAAAIADGKAVFAKTGCGACHVLAAAGATGAVGPNLDTRKPSVDKVVQLVSAGGGTMQPYVGVLTSTQIQDVAQFVYSATHG
jgi:sulfite dehydrogenase